MTAGDPLMPDLASHAIAESFIWVERLLLGSVGVVLATLAVAFVGFLMLTGRVALRRGATAIVGCFVLLGASSVAQGLRQLSEFSSDATVTSSAASNPPPPVNIPDPPPGVYDPYAGAAVPVR